MNGREKHSAERTAPARRTTAHDRREEAAALRAESRQARRHTEALVHASNAILDAAVAITYEVLSRRRIALAEPVVARFNANDQGSSGIELAVSVAIPTDAMAARRAIVERFGGEATSDRIIVR